MVNKIPMPCKCVADLPNRPCHRESQWQCQTAMGPIEMIFRFRAVIIIHSINKLLLSGIPRAEAEPILMANHYFKFHKSAHFFNDERIQFWSIFRIRAIFTQQTALMDNSGKVDEFLFCENVRKMCSIKRNF